MSGAEMPAPLASATTTLPPVPRGVDLLHALREHALEAARDGREVACADDRIAALGSAFAALGRPRR